MRVLALVLLLPQLGIAKDFAIPAGKKINGSRLRTEARAKGFAGAEVYCGGKDKCFLRYEDSVRLDPKALIAAHVFVDEELEREKELAELRGLAGKLDGGTITESEQKRILRLLIKRQIGE